MDLAGDCAIEIPIGLVLSQVVAAGSPIEGDPGHYLGKSKMLGWTAYFPDTIIRLSPNLLQSSRIALRSFGVRSTGASPAFIANVSTPNNSPKMSTCD
jgi:hypothetical protein